MGLPFKQQPLNPQPPTPGSDDGPEIRLLVCGQCKTIEPLDDFQGPVDYDAVLAVAVDRHKDGVERRPHAPAALLRVKEKHWKSPNVQDEISKRIQESFDPTAETGLGTSAYTMVDNFRADAMQCFKEHFRNPDCGDYKSASKRLAPDTRGERKELGLNPKYDENPALTKFLCEYCPVHSMVQQAARKKAGLYDK